MEKDLVLINYYIRKILNIINNIKKITKLI